MTDFETHPAGTADLVKRLRQRADQNRAIQKNNEAVASALMGQRLLFDQGIRSDANTFAVSLWLDYEICAKKDAKLSQDWGDAADSIEQLEAAHRAVMEEHDYTAKRLGHAFERIDRQAETIDKLTARANAATAAAYEVAAREVECGCGAGPCQDTTNCSAEDAAAIRALATPDQTAALDKLIAEAEARVWAEAERIAKACQQQNYPRAGDSEITKAYRSGLSSAGQAIAAAIEINALAASKKGGAA